MNQTVRNIEIGLVNGKPALTLHLDNDDTQTILFTLAIAKSLSWGLAGLCERLTPSAPGDGASASDGCAVSLQPPKEE